MRRALLTILLILAFLLPPDPHLRAAWDTSTSATVSWTQTARACLYREPMTGARVFIGCYEAPGDYHIQFGHVGPLDAAYRPAAGDMYVLQTGGEVWRAPLRWVVLLPIIR
jgi:hypothetical protein